jgi:hypothetical protein
MQNDFPTFFFLLFPPLTRGDRQTREKQIQLKLPGRDSEEEEPEISYRE